MSTRSPGLVPLRLPRPRERMPTLETVTPRHCSAAGVVDVLPEVLLEGGPVLGIQGQPELVDGRVVEELVHRLRAGRSRGTQQGQHDHQPDAVFRRSVGVHRSLPVLICGGRDMRQRRLARYITNCSRKRAAPEPRPVGQRAAQRVLDRFTHHVERDPPESIEIPVPAERQRPIAVGQDVGGARIRERRLAAGPCAAEPHLFDPGDHLEAPRRRPCGKGWRGSTPPALPSPVTSHVPERYQPCAITLGRSTSPSPCPFL